jgi:hypothetical protein
MNLTSFSLMRKGLPMTPDGTSRFAGTTVARNSRLRQATDWVLA